MTAHAPRPGDRARVSVLVAVAPDVAFRVFTEEIDQWWRRGLKYRVSGKGRGILRLESGVGGRLFEEIESKAGPRIIETGRVTEWNPPARFALEWRNVNFSETEKTLVEVAFDESPSGTLVTVTHSGWSAIRADHPARHGLEVAAFIRMNGMWWGEVLTSLREHAEASRKGS
ncbi:MAG: SRPBCC domain-containing protein [Polyangiaceae bacterium]